MPVQSLTEEYCQHSSPRVQNISVSGGLLHNFLLGRLRRSSTVRLCGDHLLSVVASQIAHKVRFSRTCLERTRLVVKQTASAREVVAEVIAGVGEELQPVPDLLQ